MTAKPLPFDINEHWANQPVSRREAFTLLSKMQRLMTSHVRFFAAHDADAAQRYSDEIVALASELDDMLTGLIVMPKGAQAVEAD